VATLTEYATLDGDVYETTAASYATIRAAAGDGAGTGSTTNYVNLEATTTANQYGLIQRHCTIYDLSDLPAGCTISSVKLYLYVYQKGNGLGSPDYNVTTFTPASDTALEAGDYDSFGSTALATAKAYSSLTNGNFHYWDFNASGIAAIIDGYNRFMLRDSWDVGNSFGGTWASNASTWLRIYSTEAGSNAPYVVVEYTEGAATSLPVFDYHFNHIRGG